MIYRNKIEMICSLYECVYYRMSNILHTEIDTSKEEIARIIQKWWKKKSGIKILKNVKEHLLESLTPTDLQDLVNNCHSISNICNGDGAGLSGGTLIDMLICNYCKEKLSQYKEHHNGEIDIKICDVYL